MIIFIGTCLDDCVCVCVGGGAWRGGGGLCGRYCDVGVPETCAHSRPSIHVHRYTHHTNTYTHAHTHTHVHTHTHKYIQKHTNTYKNTQTHTFKTHCCTITRSSSAGLYLNLLHATNACIASVHVSCVASARMCCSIRSDALCVYRVGDVGVYMLRIGGGCFCVQTHTQSTTTPSHLAHTRTHTHTPSQQ